ncbi:hypothetical protein [Desulfotomaculum sp. 1211_IL3151]|uniref:hypothetical protein n=1 Tax=Desulfotomaculum sp. 1211_IL3151 TaxID=3084055 RepID=UPI002FDB168D
MERQVKDLVEAMAPRGGSANRSFTDAQIETFQSGYVDNYDEALEVLEKKDFTLLRSNNKDKYKWKQG